MLFIIGTGSVPIFQVSCSPLSKLCREHYFLISKGLSNSHFPSSPTLHLSYLRVDAQSYLRSETRLPNAMALTSPGFGRYSSSSCHASKMSFCTSVIRFLPGPLGKAASSLSSSPKPRLRLLLWSQATSPVPTAPDTCQPFCSLKYRIVGIKLQSSLAIGPVSRAIKPSRLQMLTLSSTSSPSNCMSTLIHPVFAL